MEWDMNPGDKGGRAVMLCTSSSTIPHSTGNEPIYRTFNPGYILICKIIKMGIDVKNKYL
jgi:hypothetical protein